MAAKLHHDLWWPDGDLQYYFDCLEPADGPDSGWQSGREFTVSGLAPATYRYAVRVRDPLDNITEDSVSVTVTPGESAVLPAGQWQDPPFVTDDQFAIQMEAVTYDPGVSDYVIKYQFEYTGIAPGGDGRVYDLDPVFVDTGMVEDATYSYRTRMGLFYEPGDGTSIKIKDGPWSTEESVVAVAPDLYPPIPDPAQHVQGSPEEAFVSSDLIAPKGYYHVVTAAIATDVIDSVGETLGENENVEYKFICSKSEFSSGNFDGLNGDVSYDAIRLNDPGYNGWRNVDNVAGLLFPNGDPQDDMPQQYWARRGLPDQYDTWYILVRDRTPNQNTTAQSDGYTIQNPAPAPPPEE
jgi:hypothetical protein